MKKTGKSPQQVNKKEEKVRSTSDGCNAEEESVDEVKNTNPDMRCITP